MRTVNDDGVIPPSGRGHRGTSPVTHRHHSARQGVFAGTRAGTGAGAGE
jgi:hypothetical protein